MNVTLYDLAQRFVGLREESGPRNNGFIVWSHSLCGLDAADAVPWCSSFLNALAWMLRLPRSKSSAARSWLTVGTPIALADARPGFDVVIFKRGKGPQPGPEVLQASGHVALFGKIEGDRVLVCGGNQGDQVSLSSFPAADVLGVRRLA